MGALLVPKWWEWVFAPRATARGLTSRAEYLAANVRKLGDSIRQLERQLQGANTHLALLTAAAQKKNIWSKCASDKHGWEFVMVGLLVGDTLEVKVFRTSSYHTWERLLMATVGGRKAYIDDIQGNQQLSRGVGSALLSFAEEILQGLGVQSVAGDLQSTDDANRERQLGFYSKHGYNVTSTSIFKNL